MLSETKSRFAWKKLLLIVQIILLALSFTLNEANAQDPIVEYDGIPLIIYPDRKPEVMSSLNYQQMQEMGVFGVVAFDVFDDEEYIESFKSHNLKVIPGYNGGNSAFSHIYVYTDAYYTVWEAEGTNPANGKATLYRSDNTVISDTLGATSVRAGGSGLQDGEAVIYGPGYPQNIDYEYGYGNDIIYTLEHRMMISQRSTPPPGYLQDTVCIVKVTNLRIDTLSLPAIVLIEETVDSMIVKVADFNGWGQWKVNDSLQYVLSGQNNPSDDLREIDSKNIRATCVQFKVIWTGLNYLNLYIDRMRVYDLRGNRIVNDPDYQELVANQVISQLDEHAVIGWYGLDEPGVIDNYEPFRIVDHIVDSVSNLEEYNWPIRLHTGFYGGYNGKYRWGHGWVYPDTMALALYQDEEFWLRAKQKNLQMNVYNYNIPVSSDPGNETYDPLWRELNIEFVTDTYLERVIELDPGFAYSTQAGKWEGIVGSVYPSSDQILYHVNLGLLYGAKELRLDPFFSHGNTQGLIDINEETRLIMIYLKILLYRD